MIQFWVVDKAGSRHAVRGLEGSTLSSAIKEYGQFEDSYFMPNPFDPAKPDCHVYVGWPYLEKLPPLTEDQKAEQKRMVEDYVRAKARENSRFGYYIPLTAPLNGMTVAMGEIEPWETQ